METNGTMAKSIKDRLDELSELCKAGYVTEYEFKIARINVLKEGGIDVVNQLQHTHRPRYQEEEESKSGCGCFLLTLLLTALLVFTVAFFAAPYWPERFGGATVMEAREKLTAKGTELIDKVKSYFISLTRVPDPINAEQPVKAPLDVAEPALPAGPTEQQSSTAVGSATPALDVDVDVDTNIPSPTSGSSEPDVSAVEATTAPAVAVEQPSAERDVAEADTAVPEQPPVPAALDQVNSTAVPAGNDLRGSVTVNNARIRSAPDTSANNNVVGWGRTGERFTVLEEGIGSDGAKWYHVVFADGSKRGWVSGI